MRDLNGVSLFMVGFDFVKALAQPGIAGVHSVGLSSHPGPRWLGTGEKPWAKKGAVLKNRTSSPTSTSNYLSSSLYRLYHDMNNSYDWIIGKPNEIIASTVRMFRQLRAMNRVQVRSRLCQKDSPKNQ